MSKVRAARSEQIDDDERPHLALVESGGAENVTTTTDDASPAEDVEQAQEAAEAAPADIIVYVDSLGVSMLDRFSLVRVFREE
jgi:ferredoxin